MCTSKTLQVLHTDFMKSEDVVDVVSFFSLSDTADEALMRHMVWGSNVDSSIQPFL